MCTRYISPDQAAIERAWHIGRHNRLNWVRDLHPRGEGPFLRWYKFGTLELVVGQWTLIPPREKTRKLKYSTFNARGEELAEKPSYREVWSKSQRCIIPALSFDEPCWETGKNVWWRFRRIDGLPWGLAGLWNTWTDLANGETVESYSMLTINADDHPLMSRMHKPDPTERPDKQDKRSVVAIDHCDLEQWMHGSTEEAAELLVPPAMELIDAGPA